MNDCRQVQGWLIVMAFLAVQGCGPIHRPAALPPSVLVDTGTRVNPSPAIPGDAPAGDATPEALADLLRTGRLSLLTAARFALANNHAIRIARQQYDIAGGAFQQAGGRFNWDWSNTYEVAREYEPYTEAQKNLFRARNRDEDFAKYDLSSYTTQLRRPTRIGPVFSTRMTVSHTDDVVQGTDAQNAAEVAFTVDVPVLRGRGAQSTSADELSAAVLTEAAGLDLVHQSATTVQQVANLYWAYREADQRRIIAEASEQRARILLDETRLLVDAGQQPRASLKQLEANLEDKRATRLARTLAVVNARNTLGLSLGVGVSQFSHLPPPADGFPLPAISEVDHLTDLADRLSTTALERRQDFQAQRKRVGSADILLKAARQDVLPQLNAFMGTGYKGLHEGGGREDMYRGLNSNMTDPEWRAGLFFAVPLGNDAAKGRFKQRLGQFQQTQIQSDQLASRIRSDVATAIAAIQSVTAELSAGMNAFNSYQQALADEQEKFRLGLATSLDVINTEDRLSQAHERVISARSQLAQAVVNLRFATGRLVEPAGDVYRIRGEAFGSLTFSE